MAFPFGYGLSYTTFAYSDLKADEKGVTLTVTNTGSCAGAEIVQLYVAKQDAKVFRPVQELKGFAKVFLAPGESRTVSIALDDKRSATGTSRLTAGKSKAEAISSAWVHPARTSG